MTMITTQAVAEKLTSYLQHRLDLASLVDWAERAMMDREFSPDNHETIRNAVAHLGLADVQAFGLTWEDCESLLRSLGYSVEVQVLAS